MTNTQVSMFLILPITQSMSAVASRFMLSRSTVSRQLHQMEEELRLSLFVNKGSSSGLTLDGATLLPAVKQLDDAFRGIFIAAGNTGISRETAPEISTDELDTILAVQKYLNYSECSEILNLSESAISKRVLKTEETLGVHLFDRVRGSSIKMEESAASVFSAIEKALNIYGSLMREAGNIAQKNGKKLIVGVPPHLSNIVENRFISDFCVENPDIEIVIVEAFLQEMVERFNAGAIDVMLTKFIQSRGGSNFGNLDDCTVIDITGCDLHVVLPTDHPLADEPELSIEQLNGVPFIIVGDTDNPKSIFYRFYDACRESGFEPDLTSYPRITRGVLQSFVTNKKYATLSLSAPDHIIPGMTFVPLKQSFMKISVVLIARKSRTLTKAVSRILSFAMDYTKQHDL